MQMYPHTITVYSHYIEDNEDKYKRTVLQGVYYHYSDGLSLSGNGVVKKCSLTIEIAKKYADTFGKEWIVKGNDRLVLKNGNDISSYSELKDCFVVQDVAVNVMGSPLDNITITAK